MASPILTDKSALQGAEDVLQGLVDTLQELVHITRRVAGDVATNPLIMDSVADTKPIRHYGGEATQAHGGTGEGAGGQDVVVDGGIGWVQEQGGQGHPFSAGQVPQCKEVPVKALTWQQQNTYPAAQHLHCWLYGDTVY